MINHLLDTKNVDGTHEYGGFYIGCSTHMSSVGRNNVFSVLSLPVPTDKGCVIRRMKNGPLMIPGALKQEEVEFR